jgi:hypothetical protein
MEVNLAGPDFSIDPGKLIGYDSAFPRNSNSNSNGDSTVVDEEVHNFYPFEPDMWQTALKTDMFALQDSTSRNQLWSNSGYADDVIW